jgi:hypothetical protein
VARKSKPAKLHFGCDLIIKNGAIRINRQGCAAQQPLTGPANLRDREKRRRYSGLF